MQLTADERAKLDQMLEGTSPIPACNDAIRYLRRFGACKQIPPDLRSQLLRLALMVAEHSASGSGDPAIATACEQVSKAISQSLDTWGC